MYDVIILGGGAGGLFLADFLRGKKVLIVEHNSKTGEKIKISGGGKCNITNKRVGFENYYPKSEFVKKALQKADNKMLLKWIKNKGLKVYELKKGQYFFKSSEDILNALKPKCDVLLNTEIIDVKEGFNVITDKGVFKAKNVVVALGGKSFKKLGASEKGYEIAEKFGHKIKPLKPALVGLSVQPSEAWFKKLSGISFKASVSVNDKTFVQNILFSHRGITGPAILNASLYWERGKIKIDFLAGKKVEDFLKNRHKQIISQLPLPKAFIKEFLNHISVKDKKVMFLSKKEIENLKLLENYEFAPAGTFGFERAEVTKGGVDTEEINEFMESRKVKGLYFIGEVLDVTGELGGYNFQWAFSSAYSAFLGLSL
ncbi:BaiN/RdsA family NAD(P)/FAD-dependent oxidoreductase [Nautilia lithotrophica]